jgi:flagellar motor switch protein FliM
VVELGVIRVNVHELLGLSPGDVLQLETRVEDDLKITVGSSESFAASRVFPAKSWRCQITEFYQRRRW